MTKKNITEYNATDKQKKSLFRGISKSVAKNVFSHGLNVTYLKNGNLVEKSPDGEEKIIKKNIARKIKAEQKSFDLSSINF